MEQNILKGEMSLTASSQARKLDVLWGDFPFPRREGHARAIYSVSVTFTKIVRKSGDACVKNPVWAFEAVVKMLLGTPTSYIRVPLFKS